MMISPRLARGAKRAERGPITIRGSGFSRSLIQVWRRSARVWFEWMRTTRWPKVDSKILTSWLVRAISGTRRMVDFCSLRAFAAILR